MERAALRVAMFDDRIEIFSPGKFPNVISVDNIKDTRFARNPKICEVLNDFEIVRRLNEGVGRIYREMDEAGLPAPEFKETDGGVTLILRNGMKGELESGKEKLQEKLQERLQEKLQENPRLNKTQAQIIDLIRENNSITYGEMVARLSKSQEAIRKNIATLKEMNVLRRVGPDKGGYWEILDNANNK